jgi:hypothetical protein
LRLVRADEATDIAPLRVDDNLEESAFFERGDDSEVLGPTTSDRDAAPVGASSATESAHRRAKLRRVVAGIVTVASVIAALAAAKAMVFPARGSLEPTPEPTEPIVVAVQRLGEVIAPVAGSSLAVPSAATPAASPSKTEVRRHLAHGRRHKNPRPRRLVPSVAR